MPGTHYPRNKNNTFFKTKDIDKSYNKEKLRSLKDVSLQGK